MDDDYDDLDVNLEGREDEEILPPEDGYDSDEFIDDEFSIEDDIDSFENAEELNEDAVDRLFAVDDDDDLLDDDDDI